MFDELKKELPKIRQNVVLKNYTTFKIGGPATYFLEVSQKQEAIRALQVAKKYHIPFFILGGGSNVVVSDKGFNGLVIHIMHTEGISLVSENVIEAGAGVVLGDLVSFSIEHSLEGLEWAGGLPGTFGGAIRGNAGAFGGEIKDSIFQVVALDRDFNLKTLSNKESQFSYRSSIFKKEPWIIISAQVQLKKGNKKELQDIANSRINYRKEKHPLEYPSAGSVFKNVAVKDLSPELQMVFADKVKNDPFPIVPAAWFIIGAGLTGAQAGQAQISPKHSNYIVNLGDATAQNVLDLIDLIKEKIKQVYNIDLEVEVQYLE